jgi:hypothetical protein
MAEGERTTQDDPLRTCRQDDGAVIAATFSLLYLTVVTPPPEAAPRILADPVTEYGARGPMRLCVAGLAIIARDGEGVHVVGPVLRVMNDDYLVAITAIPARDPVLRGRQGVPLPLEGGLVAYPYAGVLPSGLGETALATDRVRYVVYPTGTRSGGVIVGSSAFNGTDSDRTVLPRLRLAGAGAAGCVRPLSFTSDQSGHVDVDAARRAGFERYGYGQSIALYPPQPFVGPGYHCQGGIGFRVEPDETLLRPWRPLGVGTSYLTHDGITIKISGPSKPLSRRDPQNPDEHPMSLLHESRIIYYKSRGVGPPYAPAGVREDDSWGVELGLEENSRMEIAFPPSMVGYRFLQRLEFVGKDDPRCGRDFSPSANGG